MKTFRFLLAATVASSALTTGAYAQSTGTVDFEEPIVVLGTRANGIDGIQLPDTTKAKGVITQELISHGTAGNSILDTINLIPGVSFQNNDPFGSAGGTLNIRGFGPDRVSLTFDGVPLNDTGNYAIYSNQQLDPELIDQVNVNLGSTDVDSPTAAASGGTVNYRTRDPYDDFGVTAVAAGGDYRFYRMFGSIDTGEFTPWGTKAFFAASRTGNRNVFNDLGKIEKQQYNARIYQPIGSNGDFISVAGHYNENRNNFFGSLPLRIDTTQSPTNSAPRVVGPNSNNRFPTNADERFYSVAGCNTTMPAIKGTADAATSCGTTFDFRYNPSNTGNIRIQSKFTLAPGLVLTVDPSYQYVKANGGGTATAREAGYDWDPTGGRANCTTVTSGAGVNCIAGYFGGNPYFGRDLNGDGDILDQVTVLAPSQTQTDRYGVISSLRYEFNPQHTIRIAYTLDYGHHRQTGEVGFLQGNGLAIDPFPVNSPALDVKGNILEKRDRISIAILNQVAGEYRGKFFGDKLTVSLGVRAPFFKRDLTNNCFTSSASGFVECWGNGVAIPAAALTQAPGTYAKPQNRVFNYDKILPNVGLNYKVTSAFSIFANYSKGLQVPGTDSLYNAFFFAADNPAAKPAPETTDSFDFGGRYTTSKLQIQGTAWYTKYNNRLASAYDPELDQTVYRNLGKVDKWGLDGSISYKPFKVLTLYSFGSYLHSEIKDNIQSSATGFLPTAGKRESGAPVYQLGGRVQVDFDDLEIGFQGKRTGKRYVFDTNLPLVVSGREVYGAVAPGYTLFDLDIRYSLGKLGLGKSWVQFNASNLFDKFYVGGFGGGLSQGSSPPFVQIGAPRALTFSVHMQM